MKKIITWSSSIIGIIFIVVTLRLYFSNFSGSLSNDQAKWGTFGDYIGGVLNPVIGIANLIILIKLTYEISQIDGKRSEKELQTQKNILLATLKHDSIKELSSILTEIDTDVNNRSQELASKRDTIDIYINSYRYLFLNLFSDKNFTNNIDFFKADIDSLASFITNSVLNTNWSAYESRKQSFITRRDILTQQIMKEVLDELNKK